MTTPATHADWITLYLAAINAAQTVALAVIAALSAHRRRAGGSNS
jgi:ABC-type spermidine/putrescine transport system permease subunit II